MGEQHPFEEIADTHGKMAWRFLAIAGLLVVIAIGELVQGVNLVNSLIAVGLIVTAYFNVRMMQNHLALERLNRERVPPKVSLNGT